MTIWHEGPIEEYAVRDCSSGEEKLFRVFDEADNYCNSRRADYPDRVILLTAIIDSGN